jgi:ferric-dicitrate binding protein FerR (iron transport regulator)
VAAEWESFKRQHVSTEKPSPWKRNVKVIRWGAAMLVAASLALLFLFHFSAPTEYVVFEATQVAQVVSMETNNGIHTLKIPRGMNQQLTLTDGTKVWLNAESTLEYPETFEGKPNREVYLKGEAYFEVTKDTEHPFRVKTDALETLVLGTSFNVRAYSKEDTQVTLVEGSVKVSDKHQGELHLQPGEHTNQKLNKTKVEKADDYHSWAEGMFYFDNTELVEIMRELGRWYNINIVFTNKEIMHDRLHFQAERKGTLEDALELLNTMQKVNARIEKDKVMIGI